VGLVICTFFDSLYSNRKPSDLWETFYL